jgi:hypothetical protein
MIGVLMGHRRRKCHKLNGRAATKVATRQRHGPGDDLSGQDVPYCKFSVPHDFPAQKFILEGVRCRRATLPCRVAK